MCQVIPACGDVVVDKLASSASIIMYAIVLYVLHIASLALPDPRRQPVIAYSMNARNARLLRSYVAN